MNYEDPLLDNLRLLAIERFLLRDWLNGHNVHEMSIRYDLSTEAIRKFLDSARRKHQRGPLLLWRFLDIEEEMSQSQ